MSKRMGEQDDFDVQGLNPDDTEQELHPQIPRPTPDNDAADPFADEPSYQENDG